VLEAVWGGNEACEIARAAAVHGYRICKMGVGIEKCGADPGIGGAGVILDCRYPALLDYDIDRLEYEILAQQGMAGDG